MFGETKTEDTELTEIIQPLLQTQLFFCQHDNSIDPSFFRVVSMFMDSGYINISNCCIQPSSCQLEPHFLEFTTVSSVVLHGLQMHHINSVLLKSQVWLPCSHLSYILMGGVKVAHFTF